jgi:lysophospholipase L1-like esterase
MQRESELPEDLPEETVLDSAKRRAAGRRAGAGWSLAVACTAFVAAALPLAAEEAGSPDVAPSLHDMCRAPRDLVRLAAPLEGVRAAFARQGVFKVVALGSSSTQGAGASNPRMCYPAQLEAELNRRYSPDKRFEVANLGVGGEMASDMLSRIDSEVLTQNPDLVIWQTGVNDAIAGRPIEEFRTELVQGIDAIRASGANVILLDLQYYPRSERVAGYREYLRTMWSVAREKSVPVLKRHSYMKHLLDTRLFTPAQILAPDLFHLNDLSYRCLGQFVADALADSFQRAGYVPARSRTASVR